MDNKIVSAILISTLLGAFIGFGLSYIFVSSQIQGIRNEISTVGYEISNIQEEVSNLEEELADDIESLQSSNNQLREAFTVLSQEHYNLQLAYEELIGKAPIGEGIRIDSIYWYKGVLPESGVRNVVIRNLGETDVTVISMKLYHNEVLQSSAALSVIIPANATVLIERFLPPSEYDSFYYYILKVETLEGYVVVSDPLPLCR